MADVVLRAENGYRCGESHQRCRLTDAQVKQARDWHEYGMPTPHGRTVRLRIHQIAEMFDVGYEVMRQILSYRRRNTTPDWSRLR